MPPKSKSRVRKERTISQYLMELYGKDGLQPYEQKIVVSPKSPKHKKISKSVLKRVSAPKKKSNKKKSSLKKKKSISSKKSSSSKKSIGSKKKKSISSKKSSLKKKKSRSSSKKRSSEISALFKDKSHKKRATSRSRETMSSNAPSSLHKSHRWMEAVRKSLSLRKHDAVYKYLRRIYYYHHNKRMPLTRRGEPVMYKDGRGQRSILLKKPKTASKCAWKSYTPCSENPGCLFAAGEKKAYCRTASKKKQKKQNLISS